MAKFRIGDYGRQLIEEVEADSFVHDGPFIKFRDADGTTLWAIKEDRIFTIERVEQ